MEVFPMSVRTITEDTVIDNICYDDLIVTSGANVTLKGTLYDSRNNDSRIQKRIPCFCGKSLSR